MANGYLTFPTLAAAQARSAQQATANGCDGVLTKYWWQVIPGPAGAGALAIDGTPYGQQGLTAAEIAALQTAAQLTAAGWTVPA